MIWIYLDDVRETPGDRFWQRTYSVNQTRDIIQSYERVGLNESFVISLDHDLGEYSKDGGDAIELVKWLIDTGRTGENITLEFHTSNVVGLTNMYALYKRYFENGKETNKYDHLL